MESPFDSTTLPSTMPSAPASTLTPESTLIAPSTMTSTAPSAPLSNVLSALTLAPTSTIQSNPALAVPSASTVQLAPTPTVQLAPTPTVPSMSPWTSTWPPAPTVAFGSSASSAEPAAVPSASWAGFSSQMDPQQLKFQIGPSSSTSNPVSPPGPVHDPSAFSRPSTSTSSFKVTGQGLFGSDVITEASRAPGLFKFQSRTPAAPNRTVPVVTPARKLAGQTRDTGTTPGRTINNAPRYISTPGTSSQTQRTTIPNLGPDVIIRPVSSQNVRNPPAAPKQKPHPDLQGSEMFQLLAGYRHLKEEVAALKAQLASGQALMHEILSNFSSEVARINVRLAAVEREQAEHGTEREHGQGRMEHGDQRIDQGDQRIIHGQGRMEHDDQRIEHGQGRMEHGQGRIGHGQGRMEHGQGRMEQRQGMIIEETGNNNVNDVQERLSTGLGKLDITKESNDK